MGEETIFPEKTWLFTDKKKRQTVDRHNYPGSIHVNPLKQEYE